ncbi:MAG: hypothetical protein Q7R31_00320 [Candidatus Levybacteria bacterium]|nr:hypothetical protein [Candidatus Levybacteria bacterium]
MTMRHIESKEGLGEFVGDPNGDKAKLAITLIEGARKWRETFGDISLPSVTASVEVKPFSPEAVTNYWRTKLQADGKRIGLSISVPDCSWTEAEIRKPMVDVKGNEVPSMLVYVPQELMGKEGLVRLGQMYPKMNNWSVQEDTSVQNSPDANKKGGWVKVEAIVDAPNLNTTQEDLEQHAKDKKYFAQTLNTFILASQANKDLTGRYLDEGSTWSRLLGSRRASGVVHADFGSGGYLFVGWGLGPQGHGSGIGGRFEEVKKA